MPQVAAKMFFLNNPNWPQPGPPAPSEYAGQIHHLQNPLLKFGKLIVPLGLLLLLLIKG